MLFGKIKALVEYGVRTGLIEAEDTIYTRNRLLEAFCEEDYADEEAEQSENLALLLDGLCDEAVKRGIIEDGATSRDLFDTKLMGLLTPRPSDVNRTFRWMAEHGLGLLLHRFRDGFGAMKLQVFVSPVIPLCADIRFFQDDIQRVVRQPALVFLGERAYLIAVGFVRTGKCAV